MFEVSPKVMAISKYEKDHIYHLYIGLEYIKINES
jgi:hypothetical protein